MKSSGRTRPFFDAPAHCRRGKPLWLGHLLKPSLPIVPGGGQPDLANEPLLMPLPGWPGDLRRLVHLQWLPAANVATVAALLATVWTPFLALCPAPRGASQSARWTGTVSLAHSLEVGPRQPWEVCHCEESGFQFLHALPRMWPPGLDSFVLFFGTPQRCFETCLAPSSGPRVAMADSRTLAALTSSQRRWTAPLLHRPLTGGFPGTWAADAAPRLHGPLLWLGSRAADQLQPSAGHLNLGPTFPDHLNTS